MFQDSNLLGTFKQSLTQSHYFNFLIISIPEVIVVTLETAKAEIAGIPKKYNLDMALDVVAIPAQSMSGSISSQTEEFGTADAIRYIHDKLKASRIMIISSDLITDVQVSKRN